MCQEKRKVVVASPVSNKALQYETTKTTFLEFKTDNPELFVGDVEAILRPGNTVLRDDSVLPVCDFTIFVVQTKNKAGAMTAQQAKELAKEVGDAIVAGASQASEEDVKNLKQRLIAEIEEFFGVDLSTDCPECDDALKEAKAFLNS